MISEDKIKQIVSFNSKIYKNSEKLPAQVVLCKEMKPFLEEKK